MIGGLAEIEVERVRWGEFRTVSGDAHEVAAALRALLAAKTPEEASAAYWQLENQVVVQGTVFEAAEPVVGVLVAALAETRPFCVRVAALGLLFQILAGAPSQSDNLASVDLVDRCRRRARDGLWVLIHEFVNGASDAAADVLNIIDAEHFEAFRADSL